MPSRVDQKLARYREMRTATRTPEPFGGKGSGRTQLFVVQKHDATRLHYDFRLELDGVLLSWAVPRGPSFDPNVKRLAMQTEDHPVEYADFEGIIPEDNYGAGAVIVWDQGRWLPLEDPREGMEKGKLLFELQGHKLRGVWTLVRTKSAKSSVKGGGASKEWLLIKKPDAWAGEHPVPESSIFSGLTVEEVRDGTAKSERLCERLRELGAPEGEVDPVTTRPMLAEVRAEPFDDAAWVYELKYDGYRLMAAKEPNRARLFYRSGIDASEVFPEVRRALRLQPYGRVLLDGEVVVLDEEAKPVFNRLQQRVQLSRVSDIEQAAILHPVTYYAFDILAFESFDLRRLPLLTRKEILREVLPAAGCLRYSDHIPQQGRALYREVERMGLEGIVAKRADSVYVSRRASAWQKIRCERTDDFVVVGYKLPSGSRVGFSSLLLARFNRPGGELIFAGRVGTGFDHKLLATLRTELEAATVDSPQVGGELPQGEAYRWVIPSLVAEVRYKERTRDGLLRHPAFLRLRRDKTPADCVDGSGSPEHDDGDDAPPVPQVASTREVAFSNLDKVFWPEEGYTKGDLIQFYRDISPWLLPYLEDRPLVLTRYPDGIHGKSFFQKDAPNWVPDWIRTERMWSEHAQREIDYFVCDNVDTLTFLVNLGTIPLHVWSSRISNLSRPDWCILDLDPKGAPFAHVVEIALAIKDLCDSLGWESFVKTSGSSGLHVLLPLGAQCTYEQSRSLAELIARVICARLPTIATIVRQVGKRGGKVYLDYMQNGHGRLLVSPFCVRPLPGAPVSVTLRWDEVNERLRLADHTIATMLPRLRAMGEDPMRPVMELVPSLQDVLGRLANELGD